MPKPLCHVETGRISLPALIGAAGIPWLLVLLRLCLGPLVLAGGWSDWPKPILAGAVVVGVASDVFHGVIARRLGVATTELRRADSLVDVIFWLSVLGAAQLASGLVSRHSHLIGMLLASEAACQVVSMVRFHRPPATHTYAAKLWGLALTAGFTLIFLGHENPLLDRAMLIFGIFVDLEVIVIMLLADRQPIDVPSIFALGKMSGSAHATKRRECR